MEQNMADDSGVIKIGTETDISSLRSGMAEAQSVIASSTAQMRESYAGVGTAATASAEKIHLVNAASEHSVSAHKAAAAAMRELEGNFTRNSFPSTPVPITRRLQFQGMSSSTDNGVCP